MTSTEIAAVRPARTPRRSGPRSTLTRSSGLGLGIAMIWFSLLVLIPLAAVVVTAIDGGWDGFWTTITNEQTAAAIRLTVFTAAGVTVVNVVMGTAHRLGAGPRPLLGQAAARGADRHPVRAADDRRRPGAALALRHRQPARHRHRQHSARRCSSRSSSSRCRSWSARCSRCSRSSTRDVEEAAASLGASRFTTFRRIILPSLTPAIAAGAALSFARGVSEYGSLVLLSGNLPVQDRGHLGAHPQQHRERQPRGGRGRRDGAAGDLARGDRGARPHPAAGGRRG